VDSAIEKEKIGQSRREFGETALCIETLPDHPEPLFERWFSQILKENIDDPTACILASVDAEGAPDTRVVLLKDFSKEGLVFFTNYHSKKAQQIEKNNKVALNFYWPSVARQIRIRGKVNKIDAQQSANYFHTRPRNSQIAAYASRQSEVTTRDTLEKSFAESIQRFSHDAIVPYPTFWGGYCVTPVEYEFWQGRNHRLHDRVHYIWQNDNWLKHTLSP
jgi:pyridoxamine 5'-phosphate oxidase